MSMDNRKTYQNRNLYRVVSNYFEFLKESDAEINYLDLYIAVFTAIGNLDKKYKAPEFIREMSRGFRLMASHLDKISHEMHVDSKNREGVYDRYSNSNNCCYTVLQIADKLGITRQAVNAAVNKGILKAHTVNGQHMVFAEDFETYRSRRRRK